MQDHLELYSSYTPQELEDEIAALKAATKTGYTSQAVGSKNYMRDINLLSERLQAAVRVRNERQSPGGGHSNAVGVVDFSRT